MKIHSNKEEDNTEGGATHPQPDYPAHQAALEHHNENDDRVCYSYICLNSMLSNKKFFLNEKCIAIFQRKR